jgi:hypothetical protein
MQLKILGNQMTIKKLFAAIAVLCCTTVFAQTDDRSAERLIKDLKFSPEQIEQVVSSLGLKKSESRNLVRKSMHAMFGNEKVIAELKQATLSFYTNQGRLPTLKEAELIGNFVGASALNQGMRQLPPQALHAYLGYNNKMLEMMNDTECVRFIRRISTDIDDRGRSVYAIAEAMGESEFNSYMKLSAEALEKFTGSDAKIELPSVDRARYINRIYAQKLFEKVKKDDMEGAFAQWIQHQGKFEADEKAGCAVGKLMMSTLFNLPEDMAAEAAALFVNDRLLKN